MFGIIQIIASQIPNIFHTKWLSISAAIMSFTYSFIGIGLGLAQVIGKNLYLLANNINVSIDQLCLLKMKLQEMGKLKVTSMVSQLLIPHKKYGWLAKLLETLHFHLTSR